jgi:xanthine dehydrogenase YagR molybdenum-binding subunit
VSRAFIDRLRWSPSSLRRDFETAAVFENVKLTLFDAVQASANLPPIVAAALRMRPEDIRLIAPQTGGGFGAKG